MSKENCEGKNIFKYFEENFDHFTVTQKRFVRYVLSKKHEAPFLSAYEVSKEINANSSTLVRFAKDIGYKGYPELQRDFKHIMIQEISQLEKAKHFKFPRNKNIISLSFNKSHQNIIELMNDTNEKNIRSFVDVLIESKKKIIIASRGSHSVAHSLYFELKKIIPGVQLLFDYDHSLYDIFEDLNEKDVIVAISFPRYTKTTIDFAQFAASRDLQVISITDSRISPLFTISKICLFSPAQSITFHNSNVALMALSEAIIDETFNRKRETSIKRLERVEKILIDQKILYCEKGKSRVDKN